MNYTSLTKKIKELGQKIKSLRKERENALDSYMKDVMVAVERSLPVGFDVVYEYVFGLRKSVKIVKTNQTFIEVCLEWPKDKPHLLIAASRMVRKTLICRRMPTDLTPSEMADAMIIALSKRK